jgi:ADP-heptose:LPS heptosyltransferase
MDQRAVRRDLETRETKKWSAAYPPRKILLIRLQALGDVVITLPYAQAIKEAFPSTTLDLLTRREVSGIPREIDLFRRIVEIRGGRNSKLQLLSLLALFPTLLLAKYDVVIDLQNNYFSRIVTKVLEVRAWVEFDRYSPQPAGVRTLNTIEQAGIGPLRPKFHLRSRKSEQALKILVDAGWKVGNELVVLNPAGSFESRHWPIDNYSAFANIWLEQFQPRAQFLFLGDERLRGKAAYLATILAARAINLVGRTTPEQAFAIVGRTNLVVTEDSGLMHMAWVSGIPTVALFGSSRSDWSRPLGPHSICLDSSDLPCGCCMLPTCRFGDNRCLTRYSPELVAHKASELLGIQERA